MSVYVIGDSHLGSLSRAFERDEERFRSIAADDIELFMLGTATDLYKDFFSESGDRIDITIEGSASRAGRFQSGRAEIAVTAGSTFLVSAGLHTSSILMGRSWGRHAPWWASALDKRPMMSAMSDAVFQTIALDANQPVLAFLAALRRRTSEVYVLAAPPPTKRFTLFRYGYDNDDVLRMDSTIRDLMRSEIAKLGIDIIEPPSTVLDEGFLASRYLQPKVTDPHHGNFDYSAIVLANALNYIVDRRTSSHRIPSRERAPADPSTAAS